LNRKMRAPRHLHSVAGAALRLLHDALGVERLDDRCHLLRLMTDDHDGALRPKRCARSEHVLDQGASACSMEHFRNA